MNLKLRLQRAQASAETIGVQTAVKRVQNASPDDLPQILFAYFGVTQEEFCNLVRSNLPGNAGMADADILQVWADKPDTVKDWFVRHYPEYRRQFRLQERAGSL